MLRDLENVQVKGFEKLLLALRITLTIFFSFLSLYLVEAASYSKPKY